jgi:hypothetical protein
MICQYLNLQRLKGEPVRSNIYINNKVLQNVNTFNYLEYNTTNEG